MKRRLRLKFYACCLLSLTGFSPYSLSQFHSWTPSNEGLTDLDVTCLTNLAPGLVFAGTANGIFSSSNGGTTWLSRSSGLNYTIITAIGATDQNSLLVGTERRNGQYDMHAENVISRDTGRSWQAIDIGHPGYAFTALSMSDNHNVYALIRHVDYYYIPTRYIIHSTDGGNSWETLRAMTGTGDDIFVYDSLVLASGADAYPATWNLLRSTDSGHTWSYLTVNSVGTAIVTFRLDPHGVIFGGTNGTGIFRSSDYGLNWLQESAGLTDGYINCLTIGADSEIYAGTWSRGLFVSSNQGTIWAEDTAGLGNVHVTAMIQDSSRHYLVGTWGGGIFTASTITNADNEVNPLSHSFKLSTNYPNPFNPATAIQFSLPRSEFVTLTIFNLMGDQVALLISERLSAGEHQTNWFPKELPSGVYFYRLKAGTSVETKKMLFIR